jgi:diguanylate cyclase
MDNVKRSTSLLDIFRFTHLRIGVIITLFCCLTLLSTALYTLKTLIEQNINQYSEVLLHPTRIEKLNSNKTIDKLKPLMTQNYVSSILIYNDQEVIEQLVTTSPPDKTELLFNFLFLAKPVYLNDHTIELEPRTKPYLKYFYLIFSALCITFALLPIVLYLYLNSTRLFLRRNIEPLIFAIQKFKRTEQASPTPYSYIREFQIFNSTFNTLLDKFESTKQNLSDQNDLLNYQAHHDVLTNLPNRQYFQKFITKEFNQNLNNFLVLLYIDNNKFKAINDYHGHQAGDAVLIETAHRLKSTLPEDAFIARLGGDEFAVVLQRISSSKQLEQICQQLIDSCFKPLDFNQQIIDFSFSVGASYGYHATSVDDFLHKADLAMYQAKKADQHWAIFSPYFMEEDLI